MAGLNTKSMGSNGAFHESVNSYGSSEYAVGDELMFLDPKEHVGGRLSSTIALVRNDLGQGIQGKDLLDDLTVLPRNFLQAGYHILQSGWPIAADMLAASDQQYRVAPRRGPVHGTVNSVKKIVESEGVFRKVSALLSEPLDGPADDIWNATTNGSEWIIEPISTPQSKSKSEPNFELAA